LSSNNLEISIGLPVYNGEFFIEQSLNHILSQTKSNFELIISDNASTDNTSKICQKFAKSDNRIHYFRQEKTIGPMKNFNFVLKKAKSKYFAWTAVDDYILPTFLEKNVKELESDENLIGSTSRFQLYHVDEEKLIDHIPDIKDRTSRKNLVASLLPKEVVEFKGKFDQKVQLLFKKTAFQVTYAVYRTKKLKECIIEDPFVGFDVPIVLNALKLGDIKMIDEVLMYTFDSGMSHMSSIKMSKSLEQGFLRTIFPHMTLTLWCLQNLGTKIFLKNFGYFLKINIGSEILLFLDFLKSFKLKK
jgi:glycosyltransferase involved in cell wall biosynthesis